MPLVTLLGLAMVLSWAAAAPCPKGLSFWDTDQQQCKQCSGCAVNEVVLLPCQPHKDTVCGPISALNINWAWLQPPPAQIRAPSSTRPPKKVRTGARRVSATPPLAPTPSPPPASAPTTVSGRPEAMEAAVATETEATAGTTTTVVWTQSSSEAPTTKVSAQPFLAHETSLIVVWDWQSLALAATIASFVVLLVVFAVYAAVHARRATLRRRSLQQELDAAQLSLFPAAVSGGGEDAEMQTLNSPPPKGMYNANQCLYLEKLLEQKQSRRANIYVETGRQATPAPARRSSRWKGKQYPSRTP